MTNTDRWAAFSSVELEMMQNAIAHVAPIRAMSEKQRALRRMLNEIRAHRKKRDKYPQDTPI